MDHLLKAEHLTRAYRAIYGVDPSKHAVIISCSVAAGESSCGDSWDNACNWGAVQRRAMTPEERASVKAGGRPTPRDHFEMLLHDSDPDAGPFQAWYWRFTPYAVDPNSGMLGQDAGAWRFLRVLLRDAGRDKTILPVIDSVTARRLAELMYASNYFGGFHKRGQLYSLPDGSQVLGSELNVRDYTTAISRNQVGFEAKLASWDPSQVPALTDAELSRIAAARDDSVHDSLEEGVAHCRPMLLEAA